MDKKLEIARDLHSIRKRLDFNKDRWTSNELIHLRDRLDSIALMVTEELDERARMHDRLLKEVIALRHHNR